jgi:hypothetical protein
MRVQNLKLGYIHFFHIPHNYTAVQRCITYAVRKDSVFKVVTFCEHGNETSVSIKGSNILSSWVTISSLIRTLLHWLTYLLTYLVGWFHCSDIKCLYLDSPLHVHIPLVFVRRLRYSVILRTYFGDMQILSSPFFLYSSIKCLQRSPYSEIKQQTKKLWNFYTRLWSSSQQACGIMKMSILSTLTKARLNVESIKGVLEDWRHSSTHSLTSALDGGEWSASRPGRFITKERAPGSHWIGGWVGPSAVLDTVMKRKIPSPHRKSNPRTPIVQPVAQRYTDWAIAALETERSASLLFIRVVLGKVHLERVVTYYRWCHSFWLQFEPKFEGRI